MAAQRLVLVSRVRGDEVIRRALFALSICWLAIHSTDRSQAPVKEKTRGFNVVPNYNAR